MTVCPSAALALLISSIFLMSYLILRRMSLLVSWAPILQLPWLRVLPLKSSYRHVLKRWSPFTLPVFVTAAISLLKAAACDILFPKPYSAKSPNNILPTPPPAHKSREPYTSSSVVFPTNAVR